MLFTFQPEDLSPQVPPGTYDLRILDVRRRDSHNSNPMVEVVFEIAHGSCAAETLRDHFVIAGPNTTAVAIGRRRLVSLCRTCRLATSPDAPVDLRDLIGLTVTADVALSEYNGSSVPRIRAYRGMAPESPVTEPVNR